MTKEGPTGLSRRDFLITTGAAQAAALLVEEREAAALSTQAVPPPRVLGPGEIPVRFLVNGKEHQARVEPRTTLAALLRDRLGLTGTKIGCDRGACGACTVWVSGRPTASCMTLALDVAGVGAPGDPPPPPITTIEGLAAGERLHPVQQAFIDHDALQCGYCTPGMIMACAAACERAWAAGKPLSEAEARKAVAGNLCRCGAYPNIIAATVAAARRGKGGSP